VELQRAVAAGLLGDLAVLRFSRSGAAPEKAWFADPALSGGIVLDQMIHDLDMARWVAGEVVRVSAVSSRRAEGARPIEAAHVLLTHRSGAISHVAGVWGPAHLRFTTGYSVTGTGGTLAHDSAAERPYVADLLASGDGGAALPDSDPLESPYYLELQEFLLAGRGGARPRVTTADGVEAVRIANAALESLQHGRPVDLATVGGAR
jgi:myo-inositol 2-dehydrogenase/D-chiro-inositol 1-dehydrogenase